MSKKIFLIMFLFFVLLGLKAQYSPKDKVIEPKFLFKNFADGLVYKSNGAIVAAKLNLNKLNQEMLFLKDTVMLKLAMPSLIDSVVIQSKVFVPVGNEFFELITGTKLKLLVKNKTRWDSKGDIVGYGHSKLAKTTVQNEFTQFGRSKALDGNVEIEYFDVPEYYLLKEGVLVPASNIKNYTRLLRESKELIKTFVKTNNLNLKKINEEILLVDYINTILP